MNIGEEILYTEKGMEDAESDTERPEDESDEEASKSAVLHPDGGWGWMVVLGSAFCHLVVVGVGRSFGVFYLDLLIRFQKSSSATAWVIALHNCARQCFGPVVGILCDKFTCRSVAIAGGLLMSIGCVISAYADSILFLYLSFGLVAGTGAALVFTPSYVIVGQYFHKKKGKAMGLATVGSGLGSVALAPLEAFLLHQYSFFGAMFIVGAITLNNCVGGALFRPPPYISKSKQKQKESNELQSQKDTHTAADTEEPQDINKNKVDRRTEFVRELKQKLSILTNVTFLLYGIEITAMCICIQTFLAFLPGLAKEFGASTTQAALLLSITGAADMVSRLVWGVFFDLKHIRYRRRLFHAYLGVAMGGFAMLNGFISSYYGFMVVCILWGLVEGTFHAQRATIVTEFVDASLMPTTVGYVIGFQGIGNLMGPPVGGWLRDITGTYSTCYIFCGSIVAFTSTVFLVNYYVRAGLAKKNSQNGTSRQNPSLQS